MGLLKRIFSIGSKRNKKKLALARSDGAQLEHIDEEEEEQEAAASRLLRSSSSRYAVGSEFDYASCPALPHPINNVIQTPAASSLSLSSSSATQRGTYTVTVHRRRQLALTEFPNANPPMSHDLTTPHDSSDSRYRSKSTPVSGRDSNCLQGLRQDPSVASLLNMYDEHGRLPPSVFSNSPPSPDKPGRVQTRRTGSTLRQLLGNPASRSRRKVDNSATEGDISWAERYLRETESMSSMSSLGLLETPADLDTRFPNAPSCDDHLQTTLPAQQACDLSNNTSTSSADYPAISSLEVEISITTDSPPIPCSPYQNENPMTPQRASQVFGFLTEKRKSVLVDEMKEPSPQLNTETQPSSRSRFSDYSSESISTQISEKPSVPPKDSLRFNSLTQLRGSRSRSHSPTNRYSSVDDYNPPYDHPRRRNSTSQDMIQDVLRPPQIQLIITAPTPSDGAKTARIPRGPRQPTNHAIVATESYTQKLPQQSDIMHQNSQQLIDDDATLHERTNSTRPHPHLSSSDGPSKDPFTPIPPRQRRAHHRAMSHTSNVPFAFAESCHSQPVLDAFKPTNEAWVIDEKPAFRGGKENESTGSAMFSFPLTPVRSGSLFGISERPSPASSTKLSPVGQQLMMNLRQQRMDAREAERRKKGMRRSAVVTRL